MLDRARIARDFAAVVNMGPAELAEWLDGEQSRSVGWRPPGAEESVGRAAGLRILAILATPDREPDDEDFRLMRKAVGVVRRHAARPPENIVTSRWRYALMNWGHDPLKDRLCREL